MGVNIKDLVVREGTTIEHFTSRIIAIDAYNAIYQFLASIRGMHGDQLTDSKGRVTSHLSGLFSRNIIFLMAGIRPVYVFDGKPPSLKTAEVERRRQVKMDAAIKYEKALAEGDHEKAKMYAQQTTSLQDGMIEDSKRLLSFMGIPCIDAPSEGEATATHIANLGLAYAAASQDFDAVLFGANRLIRNFTNSGKRKVPNKNTYVEVVPEIIEAQKTLDALGMTREQLIDIGILVGTDYNPNGFKRIGPKTAFKLVSKHGRLEDIPAIQDQLKSVKYEEIREIFQNPQVADVTDIKFDEPDHSGIREYMAERDFNADRIQSSLNRLAKVQEKRSQNLDKWF